jgi:hypothetical protein
MAAADRFAANVLPLIEPLMAEGRSLRDRQRPERARRADGAWRQMGANPDRRHPQASVIGWEGRPVSQKPSAAKTWCHKNLGRKTQFNALPLHSQR